MRGGRGGGGVWGFGIWDGRGGVGDRGRGGGTGGDGGRRGGPEVGHSVWGESGWVILEVG